MTTRKPNPILHWGWFTLYWWEYLFWKADEPDYCSWPVRLWCRMRGHPAGPIWYNPGAFEPDMRCKNCGDVID